MLAAGEAAEAKSHLADMGRAYNESCFIYINGGKFTMADNPKSFSEQWRDIIYQAHVNFLRKRDLFEDWKRFKANKKLKQDDFRLMSEYISLKEKQLQSE